MRCAVELNPNCGFGHIQLVFTLTFLGCHDEAIVEIKLAQVLDPMSPRICANVGCLLYFARRYDDAIAESQEVIEVKPTHAAAYSYLVLELVEGQTLAERLHKGPLPVDEALEVCCPLAEGLEAAREKGVIHRDLKPANEKVTPEGKVKVLDFGLARALHDQVATADLSHSPTITNEMTRPGVVLGTAAYMSPEQAKGKVVDKRADVWAFGCVLYECLTGKRTLRGDSITEVMAKILEAEPDWR